MTLTRQPSRAGKAKGLAIKFLMDVCMKDHILCMNVCQSVLDGCAVLRHVAASIVKRNLTKTKVK